MEDSGMIRIINDVVSKTFEVLKLVYNTQKEGKEGINTSSSSTPASRLVFPHYSTIYRNGETRISEQELRFAFVEQFNIYCKSKELKLYYSVETPTELKYSFKDKNNPRPDVNGQSAMVDLAIHNEHLERIALIEFKALNPDEFCYKKDFCKLTAEWENNNQLTTFFIMVLKSTDSGTKNSIDNKISSKHPNTQFRCFDLSKNKEILINNR